MTKSTRAWIQIAGQVSVNPFVKIPCPECADQWLQILIVPWEGEEPKVDIHLICPACDSRNTITKEITVENAVDK
jgi:Zn finger protein HypA/HybF involved in hydrogenase expression